MRGHVHEQFLWRVTDRGHFQPLWYGKKWRCRHSLPPPTTFDCRSIADRSVVFNGSPKARKSQKSGAIDIARQCLSRRIETQEKLEREVQAWQERRNEETITITRRFTTTDARINLKRLFAARYYCKGCVTDYYARSRNQPYSPPLSGVCPAFATLLYAFCS
jgi:hypothetical protein